MWIVNNELRLAFESLRTGDRLMLCISAFDEDVIRDDLIGMGHVDITDVAYRDAGVPGSQVCRAPESLLLWLTLVVVASA